ncbi:MAG: undecaprenyldiphospho-muramoylpentapeptide beta-N-acetylglucosaminyltransferase [Bacteroidota bacterium]|nr:undecaprenyldiphospho-muramoylpentapeptide beta-N-acetylglucosaminyltransferase [Bacteroidota bacterium]
MQNHNNKNIIISGGGTGGHIFPAISIANALKKIDSEINILFVGAKGKIEMEKVPEAGYEIIGLPIAGFQRKLSYKNIILLFKLLKSLYISKRIIKKFKPNVVVGVGGYASAPVLFSANGMKIPTLIQEQNSYAGVTNKILARKAAKICVAYENMNKYFPNEKIVFTGNPVRQDLLNFISDKNKARDYFNLDKDKKVILILGGSLGARTINNSVIAKIKTLCDEDIQIIWQTGKNYYTDAVNSVKNIENKNIHIYDFIKRMDLAYASADIIISRAGAGTISELSLVGKPVILVPSPNVAEDHQTKNAMALVKNNAAILVKDKDADEKLINLVLELKSNEEKINNLAQNINKMAMPESAKIIANEILKL